MKRLDMCVVIAAKEFTTVESDGLEDICTSWFEKSGAWWHIEAAVV